MTPLFGKVTNESNVAVVGASVNLIDPVPGTAGGSVLTNNEGRYLLRALPGTYRLVVQGQTGRAVPRISTEISVEEDLGAQQDIDLGALTPVQVFGQIMSEGSTNALRDVRIRFTSDQLRSGIGTLQIETETDGDGLFNRNLLAGTWTAEIIPAYDTDWAPKEVDFTIGTDTTEVDLGQLQLPQKVVCNSVAVDDYSVGVAGAAVVPDLVHHDHRVPVAAVVVDHAQQHEEAPLGRLDQ